MSRSSRFLLPGLVFVALVHAIPALALNTKSWVSNTGSDANPCTLMQPCASLQHAHDVTASGGEISILTPGDYSGPSLGQGTRLSISKSIHISNDGAGEANLRTPENGGIGITVQAGAGDIVSLRGLVIDGQTIGFAGIDWVSGAALHLQNCVIRNFENGGGWGVLFEPAGDSKLFASDTIIYNNGSIGDSGGLAVIPHGFASANVVLDRMHIENNLAGLWVGGFNSGLGSGSHVAVRDSIVLGNAGIGIRSSRLRNGGIPSVVLVNGTAVIGNAGAGVLADGGGVLLLSNSTLEYNGTGASVTNGGRLFTYGNNLIDNNTGEDLSPAALVRSLK